MITFKAIEANGEIVNSALHAFTFPAGEAHTKQSERELEPTEIAIIQPSPESIHDDLFQLAMWNKYLVQENQDLASVNMAESKRVLILPYMPGARADRGLPFGLSVYADFLHHMNLDQIIIFDPHSGETGDQLHAAAEELTIVHSNELFEQAYLHSILNQYTGIIAPDKGAVKRATAMADLAGLPVFTATKHRDEASGKLSGFAIDGLDSDGTYLIVDDICDGGGTFLGLAEASGLEYGALDLYVSHGVFSKNALVNLEKTFKYIYTTNSYNPERVLTTRVSEFQDDSTAFRRFDVIRLLESKISEYRK